jgi:hypothetical protein
VTVINFIFNGKESTPNFSTRSKGGKTRMEVGVANIGGVEESIRSIYLFNRYVTLKVEVIIIWDILNL